MSVGVVSSSKNMGFDDNNKEEGGNGKDSNVISESGKEDSNVISESGKEDSNVISEVQDHGDGGEEEGKISRKMSESSFCPTEDEDEEEVEGKIELGPQLTLKEQYEKDKDDESLMRWKEQLLGSVDINSVGETLDPEVMILSLAIKSPGRSDIVLPIPEDGKLKGTWFTLKEGSRYSLNFTFQVSNNIVSGLKYTNTVWKTGLKVDSTKEMIGTFSPQQEPYTHEIPEDTTPSGMFARGSYAAKTKFLDDDNRCYLEINYNFDIRKDWLST